MAAAYNGHTNVVTFLLDINVAFDSADHIESTALHYACLNNHADIVRLLVSHGAEVDPVDQKNQTPFYISCCYGHMDIIKLLLFGNEPIKRSIGSKKGTPLLSDNSSLFVPFSHHSLHINKCVDLNVKDVEGDTLHALMDTLK
ncbi:ankyrin repeat domain-containing protein 39-like [Mytilus edulis]|uniref:ankyrin repeat domain-containing protein 39-like n=1 Tax=Mytilus edulis TaxID=6550 RepID=UPI0039EED12B